MQAPQLTNMLTQYLSAQDDVAVAYLFGSYARGEQSAGSDVDIGVVFTDCASAEDLIFRRVALSQKLEDLISRPVDVTDLKLASPHFNHQVLLEACLLKGKEAPERIEFEKRVRREHFDMLPYRQRHLSASMRRLREGGEADGSRGTDTSALEAARRLHERFTEPDRNHSD